MRMLDGDDSNDVEVSWADQQKINGFSRLNQKQTEIQDELEALRTEKEQIDEVFEEIQLLEMSEDFDEGLGASDEEDDVEGTTGFEKTQASELLEKEQRRLDDAIAVAQNEVDRCDGEMKKLKVDLYAKFGNNINLERD